MAPPKQVARRSANLRVARLAGACLTSPRMFEIANYVLQGAGQVTPALVDKVLRSLPMWKVEFAEINAPQFPHLVDQLEFLADAVEDVAEGAYKELPYHAFAAAVFAITYAHRKTDIIPDFVSGHMGRADDSSIVRAVLILHEKPFAKYAESQGFNWNKITDKP
jgi:uncharacterized membrane protein YkvA (DUF1232 family)